MAFLLALLGPLGDFILKIINGMKPPEVVTESEKAGAATQALQDVEQHDTEVQTAANAADVVVKSTTTDDGLHRFESTDPNNRDLGQS